MRWAALVMREPPERRAAPLSTRAGPPRPEAQARLGKPEPRIPPAAARRARTLEAVGAVRRVVTPLKGRRHSSSRDSGSWRLALARAQPASCLASLWPAHGPTDEANLA